MTQSTNNGMRRLAVFVEGRTEMHFVERLVRELAGAKKVDIETREISGGSKAPRACITLCAANAKGDEQYFVLIFDCGGDHQVAMRIHEEHANLTSAGYEKIIGLRDVRPDFQLSDVPALRNGLMQRVRNDLIPVQFILAIMEIEAWFLAEHSHYVKMDPSITIDAVKASLSFDPSGDVSQRETPTKDLEAVYALGGVAYAKPATETISKLCYEEVYTGLCERIPDLKAMLQSFDDFLT